MVRAGVALTSYEKEELAEYMARAGHVLRNNSVVYGTLVECFTPCVRSDEMGPALTPKQVNCIKSCAKKHIYAAQFLSVLKLEESRGVWRQELPMYSTDYHVEEDQPTAEYFDANGRHIDHIEDEELLQPAGDDIPPTEIIQYDDGTTGIRLVRWEEEEEDDDDDDDDKDYDDDDNDDHNRVRSRRR